MRSPSSATNKTTQSSNCGEVLQHWVTELLTILGGKDKMHIAELAAARQK
jgi:hypothetical protein